MSTGKNLGRLEDFLTEDLDSASSYSSPTLLTIFAQLLPSRERLSIECLTTSFVEIRFPELRGEPVDTSRVVLVEHIILHLMVVAPGVGFEPTSRVLETLAQPLS